MEACFGSDTTSVKEAVGPPPPLDSSKQLFHKNKPSDLEDDINEAENTIVALLRSILWYDSRERPSASDLLEHTWFEE